MFRDMGSRALEDCELVRQTRNRNPRCRASRRLLVSTADQRLYKISRQCDVLPAEPHGVRRRARGTQVVDGFLVASIAEREQTDRSFGQKPKLHPTERLAVPNRFAGTCPAGGVITS